MSEQKKETAPAPDDKKALQSMRGARDYVERCRPEITKALPSTEQDKVDRIVQGALIAFDANPDLMKCSGTSIQLALLKCAQHGLIPGIGNDCYLIPYGNDCNFQLGYGGLLKLVRRSNEVEFVQAKIVKSGDEFSLTESGPERGVIHRPKIGGRGIPRGQKKTLGAYFEAYLKGHDRPYVEWMDVDQLEAVRSVSKAPNSPAWKNFPDEMYRAKVTRRGCKWIPLSPDAMQLIEDSDRTEFGFLFDKAVEAAAKSAADRIREPEAVDDGGDS